MIYKKEHLTPSGVNKIQLLVSNMNTKRQFPINYQPDHTIPSHSSYIPLDGNYISGFFAGDGHFSMVSKIDSPNFGKITFGFGQHVNNKQLIESFLNFFNAHNISLSLDQKKVLRLYITDRSFLIDYILPFFEQYPIYGS